MEQFRQGMPRLRAAEEPRAGAQRVEEVLRAEGTRADSSQKREVARVHPQLRAEESRRGPQIEEDGESECGGEGVDVDKGDILLDAIVARDVRAKEVAKAKAAEARMELKAAKAAEAKANAAKADVPAEAVEAGAKVPEAAALKGADKMPALKDQPPTKTKSASAAKRALELPVEELAERKRLKPPSVNHEKSRFQFLGRSGFTGKSPGNAKFTYAPGEGEYQSESAAKIAANAWLKREQRESANTA